MLLNFRSLLENKMVLEFFDKMVTIFLIEDIVRIELKSFLVSFSEATESFWLKLLKQKFRVENISLSLRS